MAVKRVLVEHLLHFFLILALSGSSICSEECARNFSTPFGVISSPNYPKNYTNNLSCVYFIIQPVGSKITLAFHDFAVDTSNGFRDYVEVRDGEFPTESNLIGNFNGFSLPSIIRSNQNILRIVFKTDRSFVNKGFNASYDTGCEIHFFSHTGVISSPNHAKYYDSDLTCVYVIKQPAGYTITLKFSYFQLEDSSKCTADDVEIRDGESPTSPMLGGPYCGSLIPPLQMTTQNAMRVTFKTNGDITFRGFNASFKSECGGNFNMSAGVISSPYYPKHYTNNLACEYVIKGPPGSKITLAFHDFNLEGKNCSSDYIEVRDGNSSVSPLLTERFCGDMMPPVLRTNQNIMRIFFKTNSLHVFQGFNASFAAGETKFPFIDCEIDFYGERGVISSPNYPQDLASNLSCVYVIRQPIGYIVTLNFSDYCLETNASSTFLEFRDGESWSSPLIENPRCGDTTPFLKTSQNNMWIYFKSTEGGVSKGFKATFTTEPNVKQFLEHLSHEKLTKENVDGKLKTLNDILLKEGELNMNENVAVVNILENAMNETLSSWSPSTINSTVNILSTVINAKDEQRNSTKQINNAQRILSVIDHLASEAPLEDGTFTSISSNLIVTAVDGKKKSLLGTGQISDAFSDRKAEDVNNEKDDITPGDIINNTVLSPSFMESLLDDSRISLVMHKSDKMFQVIRRGEQAHTSSKSSKISGNINSYVFSVSVSNPSQTRLQDIYVAFKFLHKNAMLVNKQRVCVYWDTNNNDWSSNGCSIASQNSTNFTICKCNHLSNFALLMDVYGTSNDSNDVLFWISFIGCGMSLVSLVVTIITYLSLIGFRDVQRPCLQERKQRRDIPFKILVNLCVALALSYLLFMAGMQEYTFNKPILCKMVGVTIHFLLLSALCWMAVEAFYMFLSLVLVFQTIFPNFTLKCSFFAWGLPLVIVAITMGVNESNNYEYQNKVCWMKRNAFYAAFMAPAALILFFNFAAFTLVLVRILNLRAHVTSVSSSFTIKKQIRGAFGVVFLLGLTWVFAFLAIQDASFIFQYMFVIFTTLQGFFIFVYYCVFNKEVRFLWRQMLTKIKTAKKNELQSTSHSHTTKKDGVYTLTGTWQIEQSRVIAAEIQTLHLEAVD